MVLGTRTIHYYLSISMNSKNKALTEVYGQEAVFHWSCDLKVCITQ